MSRQAKFEQLWAERHGVPAESLAQYRFKDKDGYRLPGMAAHYRTFCDTLDSVAIELPKSIDDRIAEYVQLKAENERLRKDAERYRWLRDPETRDGLEPEDFIVVGICEGEDIVWLELMDQAIDVNLERHGD